HSQQSAPSAMYKTSSSIYRSSVERILGGLLALMPEEVRVEPRIEGYRGRCGLVMRARSAVSRQPLPSAGDADDPNRLTTDLHELALARITAPTLIISARDGGFNTLPAAQFAASKIAGAKLVVYDNGGHLLVGKEREARTMVRGFLSSVGLA